MTVANYDCPSCGARLGFAEAPGTFICRRCEAVVREIGERVERVRSATAWLTCSGVSL